MNMVIINRSTELRRFNRLGSWVMISGRRKTGKTFFCRNFLNYDKYFFVRRDGNLFDQDNNELEFRVFFELFKEYLGKKKIVIDEFHRLPKEFMDYLHFTQKRGKLVLVSSTLWLSSRMLSRGSPLLGLFDLLIFGLADEGDTLRSIRNVKATNKELIEAATYLREPLIASNYKPPIVKHMTTYLSSNKLAIEEIIGEIFSEEERRLTDVYSGILRAVASGKQVSTEISSFLFSRGIIPKDNPGYIQTYLNILEKIGILGKYPVLDKKRFRYYHVSPLFDLHFYLDEKYAYTEVDIPEEFIQKVVEEKLPNHVEQFLRNFIAKRYGLRPISIDSPEIDIALTKFKRLKLVGEVKWRKKIKQSDVRKTVEKLNQFECDRILIVPDKSMVKKDLEGVRVMDASDILTLATTHSK